MVVKWHAADIMHMNDHLSLLFECNPGRNTSVKFASLAPGATSVLVIHENLCRCGRGAAIRLSNSTDKWLLPVVPYSACRGETHSREPPFIWDVDGSADINTSRATGIMRGDRGLPVTQYNTGRNGFAVNIYGGKGKMPHFRGSEVINGGLPQLGSLEEHLSRYKVSLNALISDPD